jgi:hypothetical protein
MNLGDVMTRGFVVDNLETTTTGTNADTLLTIKRRSIQERREKDAMILPQEEYKGGITKWLCERV